MINIEFSRIIPTEVQIGITYDLLLQRRHVISHRLAPVFEDHVKFVNSNPYRAWYLAMNNQKAVGTFYLSKENTIGINISEINYEQTVAAIINYVKNNYSPHFTWGGVFYMDIL